MCFAQILRVKQCDNQYCELQPPDTPGQQSAFTQIETDPKRTTNWAFSVREKFVDFLMLNKQSKPTYRFLLILHQFVATLYPSSSRFCSLRALSHITLGIFSLIQLIFPLTPWENQSRLAGRFRCD